MVFCISVILFSVFDRDVNAEDIYYGGTKKQWEDIAILYNDFCNELYNAAIHYNSSGIPSISIGEINISENEGNKTMTIPLSDAVNDCQLIMVFSGNDIMTDNKIIDIYAGDTSKTIEIPNNADSARKFIRNSPEGMRPLCKVRFAKNLYCKDANIGI